jgi:deoxyribodipyrimidine photo-lyase
MNKKYKVVLFIFRRDLRIQDNTALRTALEEAEAVIPCFILDPRQISSSNSYRSNHALKFMIESLYDLEQQLKEHNGRLYIFHGKAENIVDELLQDNVIEAIYINRDYTPFSHERDTAIRNTCLKYRRAFYSLNDTLLHEPEIILTKQAKPYTIFTPYFNNAGKKPIKEPVKTTYRNYYTAINKLEQDTSILAKILPKNISLYVTPGRSGALDLLHRLTQLQEYITTHNQPFIDTTLLSAHIKFGTYSIREIYHYIKYTIANNDALLRQLYWRDFYTQLAFYYPHVFGSAYYTYLNAIAWNDNLVYFERWCTGTTGFPLVDAGMRQLNKTGFMHNRARLVTSSFLVKDLGINWLLGERYFAQKLTDYDPAVNNGNWQWIASTGADRQPYFRILNPWLQQKKYDSACHYIKQWVPELKAFSNNSIHTWYKQNKDTDAYPAPLIDHTKASALAITLYKNTIKKYKALL